jgi:xanthine dehydrogenase YagR molybdenum-binding subunit
MKTDQKADQKTDTQMLGKPMNRVDGRAKVTGAAKYAAEYLPKGVKYGVLIQSTIAKGTIESVDDAAALKVPGVVAVITCKNAPKLKVPKEKFFDNELNLLQSNKVTHDRQNIGVVVADTYEAAREAAALVKFNYKADKFNVDFHGSGAAANEYEPPDNEAFGVKTNSSRGDAEAAYDKAAVKVASSYLTPREVHLPMEPHATTAMWDVDQLTVWDATQGVSNVQTRIAGIFAIKPENVHVICKFTGGGFGCKGTIWSNTPLTAMAAKVANAPVCLAMGRDQSFGPVGFRPLTSQRVQLGAEKNGQLTSIIHDSKIEVAHIDEYIEYCGLASRFLYACPNVATSHRLVKLDIGKPTFMRAPGEAPGMFALESALDELAYAAGVDPIQLRLINHADKDEEQKLLYSNKNLKQCYEIGAKKISWDRRNAKPKSTRDGDFFVGIGMATATYPVWAFAASARAALQQDGTLIVQSGSQDLGTGTYTIMTQIAADAFGMPVDNITFELGDTKLPPSSLSGGSTSATCVGTAVQDACMVLRDKFIDMAIADSKSPLTGMKKDEIVAADGALMSKTDSSRRDGYADILQRSGKSELDAKSREKQPGESSKYSMHSFGAHFCEVKVDPALGKVRITRWVAVMDAGKIFNMKTARSQIYGGVVMGIGMALMEDSIMDTHYGRTINADLAEYHVPVHADIPSIDVEFVEVPDYIANPLGGHGIGEIGITGAPAALANAIYNAIGVRVRDLPITLDKLIV